MKKGLPVVVLGCGSIGRRHIGNLTALGCRVTAFDPDPSRSDWTRRNLSCAVARTLDEALDARPAAAWICTPPHLHVKPALEALRRGVACYIEKPIASDSAQARALLRRAAAARVPAAVGYQMRHHPGLRWIKSELDKGTWGRLLYLRAQMGQYLPDWRPWQDYRKSYTARRAMGGGILLDGSHEIDLARWFGGEIKSVACDAAKLSELAVDVEDTAEMTVRFASGAMGSIHLDMISRAYRRGLELSLSGATVVWDHPSATLKVYDGKSGRWSEKRFKFDPNRMYVDAAKAFLARLDAPRGGGVVDLDDAARTLAVVEAASRSSARGTTQRLR